MARHFGGGDVGNRQQGGRIGAIAGLDSHALNDRAEIVRKRGGVSVRLQFPGGDRSFDPRPERNLAFGAQLAPSSHSYETPSTDSE